MAGATDAAHLLAETTIADTLAAAIVTVVIDMAVSVEATVEATAEAIVVVIDATEIAPTAMAGVATAMVRDVTTEAMAEAVVDTATAMLKATAVLHQLLAHMMIVSVAKPQHRSGQQPARMAPHKFLHLLLKHSKAIATGHRRAVVGYMHREQAKSPLTGLSRSSNNGVWIPII